MKIYLASDHQGFHLKEKLFAYLAKRGHDVVDVGDKELNPDDDFPQFAQMAVLGVLGDADPDARAILLCGGGQGMCMAANRYHGIRAVVVWDEREARLSRRENDSNVLCLPSRILDGEDQPWRQIVDTWISEHFSGAARYQRRNRQLDNLG